MSVILPVQKSRGKFHNGGNVTWREMSQGRNCHNGGTVNYQYMGEMSVGETSVGELSLEEMT